MQTADSTHSLPPVPHRLKSLCTLNCFALLLLLPISIRHMAQPTHRQEAQLFQGSDFSIEGTALDRATNEPIPFASVSLVGGERHAQADGKGRFKLPLGPKDRAQAIRLYSLGYISREFKVEGLLKQAGAGGARLFLEPEHRSLSEVEVTAKAQKWKAQRVGYHMDEGSPFHYRFTPSDTLTEGADGQEIGTRIKVERKRAVLQSVSFGLVGSGNAPVRVGIKLYSLKDNLPHRNLLAKPAVISIEPHHTGWVTVDLEKRNITVEGDFVLAVEWLSETTRLNSGSLMAFATLPRGQVTYYRAAGKGPWRILSSTLLDVKSVGMYATLLYQK